MIDNGNGYLVSIRPALCKSLLRDLLRYLKREDFLGW